jgi:thiamine-phosphate pyrophosphorylase
MDAPRVIMISATCVVSEAALLARVGAVAGLPARAGSRLAVMLRDPGLTGRALLRLGGALRAATRAVGASLLVNDRLDLALALAADGVHLGRRSLAVCDARALLGPAAFISRACHSVDDVVRAADEGAAAAVLSPIFASPGKGPPLGVSALAAARAALELRGFGSVLLVALGGVDAVKAPACFAAGAGAVAAIRGDLAALL